MNLGTPPLNFSRIPPQKNDLTNNNHKKTHNHCKIRYTLKYKQSRVVFQFCVLYSHLYYTTLNLTKYWLAVKVHGVSLSRARYSVFSRRFQFRQVYVRDSQTVVTPFMRDANYAPRNFATLEQLGLLLPFTYG